jgi:hypothetical protein
MNITRPGDDNKRAARSQCDPFAIYYVQPELSGRGCLLGVSTTLSFNKVGPGGFEIINIDGSSSPSGQSVLASWITNGCDCSTATPVWLWGDPGAKFNSSEVNNALNGQIGKTCSSRCTTKPGQTAAT